MKQFTIRNKGITFKYSVSILSVTIIIFCLFLVYNYNISKKILLENVEKNVKNLTVSKVNEIEGVLKADQKIPETQKSILQNFNLSTIELFKLMKMTVETNHELFGNCIAYEPYSFYKDSLYFSPYYYKSGDSINYENLGNENYQYFFWDWYQIPKELNRAFWSEPYYDEGGGGVIMCSYSVPFYYNEDGKLRGVVTVDISLKWLEKIISEIKIYETGYAFLISGNGTIITHPLEKFVLNETIFSIAEENNIPNLREIGRDMISGNSDFVEYTSVMTKEDGWLFYAPMKSTGWSMGVFIPNNELFADLYSLNHKLLIMGVLGVLLLLFLIIFISHKLTNPLKRLAKITQTIGVGNFNVEIPFLSNSSKEIAQLGNSITKMQKELRNYIKNLKDTTAAKEKIESELKIAHDIQQGIIPKIFPPFPEREDIDLYAVLNPARDVGGDLYDFFFLDDYRICFTVGDVSGKGVPASLFMAITRTLLRAKTNKDVSVNKIVEEINNDLCQGNENSMFVTLFIGILNAKTGIVEFCNAGHNYPYILRNNNKLECVKETHGTPVGIFENMKYKSGKFQLSKNDTVVLYTDGVTEAMDIKNNLYTDERLLKLLTGIEDHTTEKITNTIIDDVKDFVGEADPSDDITILALTYFLKKYFTENIKKTLKLVNDISELDKLVSFIEEMAGDWKIQDKDVFNINLVLEEIISNIIFYAFEDDLKHEIIVEVDYHKNYLEIMIEEDGKAFNILDVPAPDHLKADVEDRKIGGLGIHFVKKIMDKIEYKRIGDKNQTFLYKKL